jgi:putative transcriptional regulator
MAEAVGKKVRELREGRGWNQAQLGVYAGLSPATVNLIERGHRTPNMSTIAKLARVFEVEPGVFFGEPVLSGKGGAPQESGPLKEEVPVEEPYPDAARRLRDLEPWKAFLRRHAERWEEELRGADAWSLDYARAFCSETTEEVGEAVRFCGEKALAGIERELPKHLATAELEEFSALFTRMVASTNRAIDVVEQKWDERIAAERETEKAEQAKEEELGRFRANLTRIRGAA